MKKIFLLITFIFFGFAASKVMSLFSYKDDLSMAQDEQVDESFYNVVEQQKNEIEDNPLKESSINEQERTSKKVKKQFRDIVKCVRENNCHQDKTKRFHDPSLSKEMKLVESELMKITNSIDIEEATKDYNNDFFKETFKINSTLAMLASTIIQIERGESHETLLQEAESLSGERAKKFLDLMSNYESTHDENRSARNKLIYTYALKDNNTKLSIVEILEKVPFSPEELDELYSKICPREFSDEINQIIKIKYNNLARRKGYDASCQ